MRKFRNGTKYNMRTAKILRDAALTWMLADVFLLASTGLVVLSTYAPMPLALGLWVSAGTGFMIAAALKTLGVVGTIEALKKEDK